MRKTLYIIPGWKEVCSQKPYRAIAQSARRRGYSVICKNVDWKSPLSKQVFSIRKNSILFGFSLGAVLARLVAQRYPSKKILLASMTPLRDFKSGKMRKALIELLGNEFIDDVRDHLKPKHQAEQQVSLYGDKENEPGDIIVPNTGHRLTAAYRKELVRLF